MLMVMAPTGCNSSPVVMTSDAAHRLAAAMERLTAAIEESNRRAAQQPHYPAYPYWPAAPFPIPGYPLATWQATASTAVADFAVSPPPA